jgi:hypothetical protein
MNNEKINTTATDQEDKAVNAVFSILLIFVSLLTAFCGGYFLAMRQASELIKTIVN